MPVAAVVSVLFQVYFGVHAIRTGKDRYWLFILFCFPGLGCLIYFIAEFLPEWQQNLRIRRMREPQNPAKRLRFWRDQVELTPSVKNRMHLAEACVHAGRHREAIELYQACLQGLQEQDPHIMEGLALAYFLSGRYADACRQIEKLRSIQGEQKNDEFDLLHARALEAQGDIEGALNIYAPLADRYAGEEARCRFGLLLKKTGRGDEARAQFQQTLNNARLSQRFYGKAQKEWINIARREQ